MSESPDPLRVLFKEAAAIGQSRARPVPSAVIGRLGTRRHRVRVAVSAAAACLVLAGGGAGAVALLSGGTVGTLPSVTPMSPSPTHVPGPPEPDATTSGGVTEHLPKTGPPMAPPPPNGLRSGGVPSNGIPSNAATTAGLGNGGLATADSP